MTLRVTDDFGERALGGQTSEAAPGSETVMRQLQRSHSVETRYSGRYVQSINGLSGGTTTGRPVDWFFFVNGIESPTGAADVALHRGDAVWWDRRDWGQATHVPAVVGSWPQPLKSAVSGKKVPVSLICSTGFDAQCSRVETILTGQGVTTARRLPSAAGKYVGTRVLVGDWHSIDHDQAAVLVGGGPGLSGVYARPVDGGKLIEILDSRGEVVTKEGAGSGMVAATADGNASPTWFVTGTDAAGVGRAINALSKQTLQGRYAVVIPAQGSPYGVPRKR